MPCRVVMGAVEKSRAWRRDRGCVGGAGCDRKQEEAEEGAIEEGMFEQGPPGLDEPCRLRK